MNTSYDDAIPSCSCGLYDIQCRHLVYYVVPSESQDDLAPGEQPAYWEVFSGTDPSTWVLEGARNDIQEARTLAERLAGYTTPTAKMPKLTELTHRHECRAESL